MPNLGGIEPEKLYRVTLGLEITDAPDVMNSNRKFDVSLYGTLLLVSHKESECLCCNSRCANLSSFLRALRERKYQLPSYCHYIDVRDVIVVVVQGPK